MPSYAVGIDIGGSGCRMAGVDVNTGQLVTDVIQLEHNLDTHPDQIVKQLIEAYQDLNIPGPVGIGFPAQVKMNHVVTASHWGDENIAGQLLEQLKGLGIQPWFINDADASGFAHFHLDDASTNKMMITIGTGIGTSVWNGQHFLVNSELGKRWKLSSGSSLESSASGRVRSFEQLTVKEWCNRFKVVLHLFIERLNPSQIYLTGGILEHWSEIQVELNEFPLERSPYFPFPGIIGAALYGQFRATGGKELTDFHDV